MAAHFKNAPDAFNASSNARDVLNTYCPYRVGFDLSRHYRDCTLCHWPVGKEPYRDPDGIKIHTSWSARDSHTCLMGAGAWVA